MDVELPQGCNVVYNGYIDNYRNNTRTRYYLINQRLIPNSTGSYSSMPSGYICYSGKLEYKPELKIYFPFLAFVLFFFVLIILYKIILKRLIP